MRRPASTALLAYGRDLNVAKLTQALNDVDDELGRLPNPIQLCFCEFCGGFIGSREMNLGFLCDNCDNRIENPIQAMFSELDALRIKRLHNHQ